MYTLQPLASALALILPVFIPEVAQAAGTGAEAPAASAPTADAVAPVAATDSAAEPKRWEGDPLFPGAGRGSVGVATGVPFVGIGEVAYAPSAGFAIGGIVGVTPMVVGFGLRPRVSIPVAARTKLTLVVPLLYYPTGEGLIGDGPPWFLAQPSIRAERRIGSAGYLHVSAGLIGAIGAPNMPQRLHETATYNGKTLVDSGTPWGVWNTVGAGGAVALSPRTNVFADALLVMRGVRLAGDEWVGGPPFAFSVGINQVL
jgi:hypothetical protein